MVRGNKDWKRRFQRGREEQEERQRRSVLPVVQHGWLNALWRPSSKLLHHQKHSTTVWVCVEPAARYPVRSVSLTGATAWHVCHRSPFNPLITFHHLANVQLWRDQPIFPRASLTWFLFVKNTSVLFSQFYWQWNCTHPCPLKNSHFWNPTKCGCFSGYVRP